MFPEPSYDEIVLTDPLSLEGRWEFDRRIDDRLAGEHGTVTGTAEFVNESDGRVRWTERGIMAWQARNVPVSRTLFLELRDDGWFVTFEDRRDFHRWIPGEVVDHPCNADLYRGLVAATQTDRWTMTWEVRGPAKDYTMVTDLVRSA